jgi:hypothetical protein
VYDPWRKTHTICSGRPRSRASSAAHATARTDGPEPLTPTTTVGPGSEALIVPNLRQAV